MGTAPFQARALIAAGAHLSVTPDSLQRALGDVTISISCGQACRDGNDHHTSELVVDLVARLYPRIRISGDPFVARGLIARAKKINPQIEIVERAEAREIKVGLGGGDAGGRQISGSADGWVASVGWGDHSAISGTAENPYAAGVAGVLVAAEVFRTVFADRVALPEPTTARHVSLLDFGEVAGAGEALPPTSIGRVCVVGLGAVGNAAVWAWARHKELSGGLDLVEPESVELSNLQRYVLPGLRDVGRPKVDVVSRSLSGTSMKCARFRGTLEQYAERFTKGFTVPTVCVSVDNVAGRRQAQALLPRLIVNGWTSDTGGGASWHRFGEVKQACLACLYQPVGVGPSQTELVARALGLDETRAALLWITEQRVQDEDIQRMARHLGLTADALSSWRGRRLPEVYVDLVCGSVALDVVGAGRAEAVPLAHQSVLAGLLMAVEAVKRTSPELELRSQTDCLTAWEDILRPAPRAWTHPRARMARCICGDPDYVEVYRAKWAT